MRLSRAMRLLLASMLILTVFLSVPATAQGPTDMSAQSQATGNKPPDPPQPTTSDDDVWNFQLAPYIWIPGIHGSVGALGREASVHVSGSDLFSDFDGGLAGFFQARKGRLVMPIDFIWTRVATDKGIPENELGQTSVRALLTQTIFTPKVGYRVIDGEHLKFDALVGIRYWYLGQTLTLRPSNNSGHASANWVDAVGGGKFEIPFSAKAWITIAGDVGGGSANLDYQAVGLINFQPKPKLGFMLGWRYLDIDYENGNNGFIYDVAQSGPIFGLNMMLGGRPPVPPSAACSVSPSEVWAGEPVTATINTQNFNPKHTITYSWSSSAKVSGTSTTGNVDTTGLAPGTYTVTGTATDAKEKKNNVASCNASFMVKQPHPPQASCSASPDTVKAGEPSTVSVSASSPDNFPLTYAWSSTAGSVSGTGTSATLNTAGAAEGSAITATATVTDSRGLSATCTATVNVLSAPVTVNEVQQIGECKFGDSKRPWRVDNTCKAVLDDVALRIQREPSGKFVIVGYADEEEKVKMTELGAQRAVNVKYYLTEGEGKSGIDASRLEPRTGTVSDKSVKIYFVPSGATLTEETMAIDETRVKGQARNAPAPKKTKKSSTTQTPPTP